VRIYVVYNHVGADIWDRTTLYATPSNGDTPTATGAINATFKDMRNNADKQPSFVECVLLH
jgi:hypothetical protein